MHTFMYNVHFNYYKEVTGIILFMAMLVCAGPMAKIYISVIIKYPYPSFYDKICTYFLEHS